MLSTSNLIAFAATANPERARDFYQKALGLKLVSEDPFAIVFDANGIMFRLQKVQKVVLIGYTTLGWQVKDIQAEIKEIGGEGVRFERFDGLGQDDLGIWTSPSGAKIAWFKDPDGNILSLTQF
jgi:catechol 2,3-dioxygenase-like lactoylglutathione lyase family enzyme